MVGLFKIMAFYFSLLVGLGTVRLGTDGKGLL